MLNHGAFTVERISENKWWLNYNYLNHDELYYTHIEEEFRKIFFPTYSEKEITVITGLLFISAASRHNENVNRQIALYLTGIKLLNEGLDSIKE
jgi:hypothetical protein